jgi:4'-phosphopantetheinyl transferase
MSSPWTLPFDFTQPPALTVAKNVVDVWQLDLDAVDTDLLLHLRPWLSSEEISRVERMVPPVPRRRALAMRGLLRWLLAGYLRLSPEAVSFGTAEQGKPFVEGHPLRFNVSHSQNIGLVAVALCEVGVDVEKLRSNISMAALVERYFSATEKERFRQLTADEQQPWFFRCWTRKEALLKACGLGIQMLLDQVEVGGDGSATKVPVQDNIWHLQDISQGEYAATLAGPANETWQLRWMMLEVQSKPQIE